jgi:hypothetical protein
MTRTRLSQLFRIFAWTAGVLIVLLVGLHFLLPHVLNVSSVRTRLLAAISNHLPGEVYFGSLKPAVFPYPRVVIEQGRYDDPELIAVIFDRGYLRPKVWPLFSGQLELDTLVIDAPEVVYQLSEAVAAPEDPPQPSPDRDVKAQVAGALAMIGSVMGDASVEITEGRLTLIEGGQTRFGLDELELDAAIQGQRLMVDLALSSNVFTRLTLQGFLHLSTLNANADLAIQGFNTPELWPLLGLQGDAWMPGTTADLELVLESDRLEVLDIRCQLDAAELRLPNGERFLDMQNVRLTGGARWSAEGLEARLTQLTVEAPPLEVSGSLNWPDPEETPGSTIAISLNGDGLDITAARTALLTVAGDLEVMRLVFDIVQAGRLGAFSASVSGPDWGALADMNRLRVDADVMGARIGIPEDVLVLEDVHGKAVIANGRLTGTALSARVGQSSATNGSLDLSLFDDATALNVKADVAAELAELPAILKLFITDKAAQTRLDELPPLTGTATGRLVLGDRLDRIAVTVTTEAQVGMLDANLRVSGKLAALATPHSTIALKASGDVGLAAIAWVGRQGNVAETYLPKAPVTLKAATFGMDAEGGIAVEADMALAQGLAVSTDIRVQSKQVHVKRLHMRDAGTDAVITFRTTGETAPWQITFKGTVDAATLDGMNLQNRIRAGSVTGDIAVELNREAMGRSRIAGTLSARGIDIPETPFGALQLPEASVQAEKNRITIPAATIKWDESQINLSGRAALSSEALKLDMAVAADTLDIDKLLLLLEKQTTASETPPPARTQHPAVEGRATVQINDLAMGGYRYAGVEARVEKVKDNTSVDITAASVCGVDIPGQIRIGGSGVSMGFYPSATQAELEYTKSCLTNENNTERYAGIIDINGEIKTTGNTAEALRDNLSGTVALKVVDGRIFNVGTAGFMTNLLSFISINQYLTSGVPDLTKDEFPFMSIEARLAFKDGRLNIEEGVLKSNVVNLATSGHFDLASGQLNLDLLVSPLTTVDWIIKRIPIVNRILADTLVAIPVKISGPVTNPKSVPLSPSAVSSRVGGILQRAVETPFQIIAPMLPGEPKVSDQPPQ